MLCNITSDLGEILKDGENAMIVPEVSVEAMVRTLERAISMPSSERNELRQNSLECAAALFDYRRHADRIGAFVREVAAEAAGIRA